MPFHTNGRWISNAKGKNVTYVGVNWPGAADVMIPEGLQYTSIAKIVSDIKSLGMNAIRLTFAIEMIDDILDKGGDVKLSAAFNKALGATNGSVAYQKVLKNNPGFSASTTRLQVYDAIAAECFKQQIYIQLDNHMSNGYWCCGSDDGNAWFGDKYFNVAKWKRGLEYMVKHGKSWPALTSIGMRNELRDPVNNATLRPTYNWSVWYTNMVAASKIINAANPDLLVLFSGLNYDTQLGPVVEGTDLGNGVRFRKADFGFQDKIILELHNYDNSATACSSIQSSLFNNGFSTLTATKANTLPMLLTEWGHNQADNSYKGVYATCLRSYLPAQKVGWFYWVVAGSYYIRSGTQDYEETWGLYNHDWSGWRSAANIVEMKKMVKASLG
ncbi:related to cellulase [Rhynchosporium graminicola]|uniref:Related to cellulase n=1 Tax=Rhynchosporium graminicola TaxID=2792576 RepID=A0A1E1JTJ2_9HELO|nr:related to cellulase [Rhynchosporium commune]